MSRETLEAVVRWQNTLGNTHELEITFHGGEPLVPAIPFYRTALPLLRQGLAPHRVRFALQSNLWLLSDELCDLFREYSVSLGTSLDGPEAINDAQRGKGYFERTMAGLERARKHGVDAGCICTFTAQSAPHAQEIFDSFLREGLNFSIHVAVLPLRHPDADGWSISAAAHGQLLVDMLERYLANLAKIRISTLDAMCRSVSSKRGSICTFTDCLGGHLAVAPGDAVRALGRELGIRRVQFRPVLPLGRAVEAELDIVRDTLWGHLDPREMVAYGMGPKCTCGMGQNLYVEPDGSAYPCYAWHGAPWRLGNVIQNGGLAGVMASAAFQDLHHHTVNSNRQCRLCALRFLCGGVCRAWNCQSLSAQIDLDAPPADCSRSFARAHSLLTSGMDYLGITPAQWQAAGLPLRGKPPKIV